MSQHLFSTKRQTRVGPEPNPLGAVEVMRHGKATKLPSLCGIRKGERFRMLDAAGHWGEWMIALCDAELRPLVTKRGYRRDRLSWGINAKREEAEHA